MITRIADSVSFTGRLSGVCRRRCARPMGRAVRRLSTIPARTCRSSTGWPARCGWRSCSSRCSVRQTSPILTPAGRKACRIELAHMCGCSVSFARRREIWLDALVQRRCCRRVTLKDLAIQALARSATIAVCRSSTKESQVRLAVDQGTGCFAPGWPITVNDRPPHRPNRALFNSFAACSREQST
jgi:hypothetical protein